MKVFVNHARAVEPWTSVVVHFDVPPYKSGALAAWAAHADAQREKVKAIVRAIADRVRLPRQPRVMRTAFGVRGHIFIYHGKPRDADRTRLSKVKRLAERELEKFAP